MKFVLSIVAHIVFYSLLCSGFILKTGERTVRDAMNGTCGENLTWFFDANTSILTISGVGPMFNFTPNSMHGNCTPTPSGML